MTKKTNNNDLFNKLAAAENDFFSSQLFSPVLKGKSIRVRIAGILVTLQVVKPKNFEGWGVFTPVNYKGARFIREPNMVEKEQYFRLFPALRLILCRNTDNQWAGVPANQADTRFKINGVVPIQLISEVQMFDHVKVRFDGANIWFEQIDPRSNPRTAIYLRESLTKLLEPKKLEFVGLTQEDRDAYQIAYAPALAADIEAKRDKNEDRIKDALHRAGAKYQSYIERKDTYTIEYTVDGHKHRSVVNKDTLSVESAGICLAGTDRQFDLQSLVGVIRQGQRQGGVVRVGDNRIPGDGRYGYTQEAYDRQMVDRPWEPGARADDDDDYD
jgi:hypothetical protein